MKKRISLLLIGLIIANYTMYNEECFSQWTQTNGPGNSIIYSLAGNGSVVYAGTNNGFFLTTNSGNNWIQTPLNNLTVRSISYNGSNTYAGTEDGVFKSTNYGSSWFHFAFYVTVPAITINGSNIFLGTDYKGIYRSINNGNNWSTTSINDKIVHSIAVSGNNVFAGTNGFGVYKSSNNGINWTQIALQNKNVNAIAITGNNVFAGTDSFGIFLSTNIGTSWVQTSLNDKSIYSLYTYGSYIFAGTSNGVYFTRNNGINWFSKNQGFITNQSIFSITAAVNYIYAGTDGNKVWRRLFSEILGAEKISSAVPDKYYLCQNYPNPFNPNTNIKYEIAKNSLVALKVYDLMGKEMETLVYEKQTPGTYEVMFNGSNLASGIYFYKLLVDNKQIETKKMTLIK